MKKIILSMSLCLLSITMWGQIVYYDAAGFPLLGKATNHTITHYERLPDSLENKIRPSLWELGRCSAGLAVRFRSNSSAIAAKWEVLYDQKMSHMNPTGVKGLDLYALVDGKWRFVNSGRPQGKNNTATIISNMHPLEREYMLYLSLYDCVTSLKIGIDSTSTISQPQVQLPVREKPVVCYGTSIQQGCSATRPGMAHTNILSRWLNREFINLGFSGNAQLDFEIADVVAGVDASLYILDFVPNSSVRQIEEKTNKFYSIIRDKHPQTPILFVENPVYTHGLFDQRAGKDVEDKNKVLNIVFNSLKTHGEKNIYLLSAKDILGTDGEATIDGIHFTDVGFMRYARLLLSMINKTDYK